MLPSSPLLGWSFALVLLGLGARAAACLALSRRCPTRRRLSPAARNREIGHAAMGFGMAALLAPGVPRPPLAVSTCFFAALAAFAAYTWVQRLSARRRGRSGESCAPDDYARLLDPHHAVVGAAMVVMLLRPGMHASATRLGAAAMPGMVMAGTVPSTTVLAFLGYVWVAALVLGFGLTGILSNNPAAPPPAADESWTLLSCPAIVYASELAMTVLTGLMLLI